jgi:hypothetical protein
MVHGIQKYSGSGLCPPSGILDQWLTLLLFKGPNRVDVFLTSRDDETDPVSETLCLLDFRIPNRGQVQSSSDSHPVE